jgi:hypothetical protein
MVRLEGKRVVLRPLRQDELNTVLEARDRLQIGARSGGTRARERLRRRLGRSGQMARGHLDLAIEAGGHLIGEIQARSHPAQTRTAVDNAGMCHVLERLSFTCEGVMRAYAPEGSGRPRADYALYAVTADDWTDAVARRARGFGERRPRVKPSRQSPITLVT